MAAPAMHLGWAVGVGVGVRWGVVAQSSAQEASLVRPADAAFGGEKNEAVIYDGLMWVRLELGLCGHSDCERICVS